MERDGTVVEALVVLDVITTFEHDDGELLRTSMRTRGAALQRLLSYARARMPVIYVNDAHGIWDGDAPGRVARALAASGGDVVRGLAPARGDFFLFKPRYSGFDGTPLAHVLGDLEVTRLLLAGAATEMCVAQTAIDAREQGYQVTILRDACATIDPANERISLDYLEHVTGTVIMSVNEWLAQSGGSSESAGGR